MKPSHAIAAAKAIRALMNTSYYAGYAIGKRTRRKPKLCLSCKNQSLINRLAKRG